MIRACFFPTRMNLPDSVEIIPCTCTFGHFQHPLVQKSHAQVGFFWKFVSALGMFSSELVT